jgi:hypothetical protein
LRFVGFRIFSPADARPGPTALSYLRETLLQP